MDEPGVNGGERIQWWKRFDVVADDSDHHYLKLNRLGDQDGASKIHKKIMQEWKILDENLPETILVRVYERRIDLLRAVIVGAAGTPYHDGLFFFDIAFPPDYPAKPPQVHYRSFGLRLNPNLYANGVVCLSLINTWPGSKKEKWNPSESTILQVLVSLQGLVLNEKPYYNEPGTGIWPSLLRNQSAAYTEYAFVLSCKTMIYLIRRPPKNFQGFVAQHFRECAHLILRACLAYTNCRVRVGCYREDGISYFSSSSESCNSNIKVSTSFKASIDQLYPQLVTAFANNGTSMANFVEQLRDSTVSSSTTAIEKKTEKKRIGIKKAVIGKIKGITKNVRGKIKQILGFKRDGKQQCQTQ